MGCRRFYGAGGDFMQDGAEPRRAKEVAEWFADARGADAWPPGSPELGVLEFRARGNMRH